MTEEKEAAPEFPTPQDLAVAASKATIPEEVRDLSKTAATSGWLRSDITHPETGASVVMTDYLTETDICLRHPRMKELIAAYDNPERLRWGAEMIDGLYGDDRTELRKLIADGDDNWNIVLVSSLTTMGKHAPILDLDYLVHRDDKHVILFPEGNKAIDREPYLNLIAALGRCEIISEQTAGHHFIYASGKENLACADIEIGCPFSLRHSRTPGHHHLYLDVSLTWPDYLELLKAFLKARIIQEGYVWGTENKGMSHARLSLTECEGQHEQCRRSDDPA